MLVSVVDIMYDMILVRFHGIQIFSFLSLPLLPLLLSLIQDLLSTLLPIVTESLVSQLFGTGRSPGPRQHHHHSYPDTMDDSGDRCYLAAAAADEDIRSASASALLPIVDRDLLSLLGSEQFSQLLKQVWLLLGDSSTDLSPATGPLLQLVSALTLIEFNTALRFVNELGHV